MNFGFRIVDDVVAKLIATMIENKNLHLSPKKSIRYQCSEFHSYLIQISTDLSFLNI